MKVRIVTGVIIALILLPVIGFSEYIIYPIAMSLLALTALYEMFRVLGVVSDLYLTLPSYLFGAVFPILAFFMMRRGQAHFNVFSVLAMSAFIYLLYIFVILILRYGRVRLEDGALVFMTSLYIVASFTSLTVVRYMPGGVWHFGIVFITAWVTDIFAYFTGCFFGKHKLSPKISPKKTVEGAVGGLSCTVIVAILAAILLQKYAGLHFNVASLVIWAVLVSIFGQFGDLCMSVVKRIAGVKDFGNLLPGHGGILDRFDSHMFAVAFTLVFCALGGGFIY